MEIYWAVKYYNVSAKTNKMSLVVLSGKKEIAAIKYFIDGINEFIDAYTKI